MAGRTSIYDSALKVLREDSDILKASVISDIGDFAHVITIRGRDLNLKLQIPRGDDGLVLSLQSPHLTEENSSHLAEQLRQFAVTLTDSPDLPSLVFSKAREGAASFPANSDTPGYAEGGARQTVESGKKRKEGGGKKNRQVQRPEGEKARKKKVAMKTAEDVVKRVLWDEAIPSDDITIGYIDRFRGLQEKAFSAFSWEDIASVDYFTFAIPKHRIQYFKYKRLIVWDKTRRLDNVFGSTGSGRTIHQEMAEYREEDHIDDEVPAAESATVRADAATPRADVNFDADDNIDAYGRSDSETEEEEEEEDSDDDGVVVTLQERGPEMYSGSEDEDEDDEELGNVSERNMMGAYAKSDYWRDKLRPNFFLCIRVTAPEVRAAVGHVQDVVVEREPRYETCCVPENMLHVTLCTMRFENAEEAAHCLQVMRKYADELRSLLPKSPLRIAGLDRFFHRVLYARVHHGDDFLPFVEHLCTVLRSEGIRLMDNHDFVPHMTVMKVSRPVSRAMRTKYISPDVFSHASEVEFGEQKIDSLYLCSMEKARGPDGFYLSPGCITFMKEVL